jgi:hypothetical protein
MPTPIASVTAPGAPPGDVVLLGSARRQVLAKRQPTRSGHALLREHAGAGERSLSQIGTTATSPKRSRAAGGRNGQSDHSGAHVTSGSPAIIPLGRAARSTCATRLAGE